jgi:hypothetical protein
MEDLLLQSHDHVVACRFPFVHSSPGRLGGLPFALMTKTAVPGWEESQERLHLAFQAGTVCKLLLSHWACRRDLIPPSQPNPAISSRRPVLFDRVRQGPANPVRPCHPRITQYGATREAFAVCMYEYRRWILLASTNTYLFLGTLNTHARLIRGHSRNFVLRRRHPDRAPDL